MSFSELMKLQKCCTLILFIVIFSWLDLKFDFKAQKWTDDKMGSKIVYLIDSRDPRTARVRDRSILVRGSLIDSISPALLWIHGQFIKQEDFTKKWIDRFGSLWDYRESEFPAQPYNPGKDRIFHLCYATFKKDFWKIAPLKWYFRLI